jgi:threonine aldolase
MANQIAVMVATRPGDEVILGEESHLYNLEVGGLSALAGVQSRIVKSKMGKFDPTDLKKAIRNRGIQAPISQMLCLENTYDLNRGYPLSPEYQAEMAAIARQYDMFVYLDGARIFNAAQALNVHVSQLAKGIDALQFCLTKGLAAPFGSLLLGSNEFIAKARWIRQRIGGGMRQAGHMAAAGIVALETMTARLKEDHDNARRLAEGLCAIDERLVELDKVLTNIVQIDFGHVGKDAFYVTEALMKRGIKIKVIGDTTCRMIAHAGVNARDVDEAIEEIRDIIR